MCTYSALWEQKAFLIPITLGYKMSDLIWKYVEWLTWLSFARILISRITFFFCLLASCIPVAQFIPAAAESCDSERCIIACFRFIILQATCLSDAASVARKTSPYLPPPSLRSETSKYSWKYCHNQKMRWIVGFNQTLSSSDTDWSRSKTLWCSWRKRNLQ